MLMGQNELEFFGDIMTDLRKLMGIFDKLGIEYEFAEVYEYISVYLDVGSYVCEFQFDRHEKYQNKDIYWEDPCDPCDP